MKRFSFAAMAASFALGAFAPPALALSCQPFRVTDAWHQADDAPETYAVVNGVLTFDEKALPKTDMQNQRNTPPETAIPAHMKGYALNKKGFTTPFDKDVTLNVKCSGPWCGGAKSGIPYLGFLKQSGSDWILEVTACGGFGFGNPSNAALQQVISCSHGKACSYIRPR